VLDLNAAKGSRGSDASVRLDGDNGDLERLGAVRVALDVDHGAAQSLWSDVDEVKLLAAAAAFRERTGRPPLRLDAGALFDSIKDSVSPHIDEAMADDKLMCFESKFLYGALASSTATHDRRVHDLSTRVWGALDVVPLPEDESEDQGADESYKDERRLLTERAPMPAPSPCLDAPVPSERSSASSIDAGGAPTLPSHDERRLITEHAPMPALSPRLDAPLPSERSSASSMDADTAPTPPCPDERRLITGRAPCQHSRHASTRRRRPSGHQHRPWTPTRRPRFLAPTINA